MSEVGRQNADDTAISSEAAAADYLAAMRSGHKIELGKFLPERQAANYLAVLKTLVLVDSRELGGEMRAELYFRQFPELLEDRSWAAELVAREFVARQHLGGEVELSEYRSRFPELSSQLEQMLRSPNPPGGQPSFDKGLQPGTVIDDFEIQRLIGRGGHAEVYLARQRSLERLLALKVSKTTGAEAQTLARLDHPNIVTAYSQHIVGEKRLLAMQYVDGRGLDEWIQHRRTSKWNETALQRFLNPNSSPTAELQHAGGRSGFAAAMCRVMLDVANGLAHAHQRHVLHRDIKPANILLSRDGVAKLADFGVSVVRAGNKPADDETIGGTLGYMAPEHLAMMSAAHASEPLGIDERADIYSLGVVLYELLAGCRPWHVPSGNREPAEIHLAIAERVKGPQPLPTGVPGATPALAAIVRKCLEPRPEDRYQHVREFIEDSRRWLDRRPLIVATNTSRIENTTDWARLHRVGLVVVALLLLGLAVGFATAARTMYLRLHRAERLLADARSALEAGDTPAAAARAGEARGVLADAPSYAASLLARERTQLVTAQLDDLRTQLADIEVSRLDVALLRRRAAGLVADSRQRLSPTDDPLQLFNVLGDPQWERDSRFVELNSTQQQSVRETVTELLLLSLHGQADEPNRVTVKQVIARLPEQHQRLALVRKVEAQQGWDELSTAELASVARTSFEHYLVATIAVTREEYASSTRQLSRSFSHSHVGRPRLWAHFLFAYCCQQLGRTTEAIEHYGICIGQRPDFVWPYYNLGLLHANEGRLLLAEQHLRQAVKLDSELGTAHADLGAVLLAQQKPRQALELFEQAINLSFESVELYENCAAARTALGDERGAGLDRKRAAEIQAES